MNIFCKLSVFLTYIFKSIEQKCSIRIKKFKLYLFGKCTYKLYIFWTCTCKLYLFGIWTEQVTNLFAISHTQRTCSTWVQISDAVWMVPATWHIFVFELLMPDWLELIISGIEPLCKQRQLYIYIYLYIYYVYI